MSSVLEKVEMCKNLVKERPHLIPCVIAALTLLGALGQWPYGYYQLLRFVGEFRGQLT